MDSIDRTSKLRIDLSNHVGPIARIVKRIGSDMVAKLAEHHPKGDCSRRIKTILVVKIDCIESRDGSFQRHKVLIEDAIHAGALGFHQSRDIFPVAVIR
jgi:hypothetical protein